MRGRCSNKKYKTNKQKNLNKKYNKKQQNLNLYTLTPKNILELQNKIGNGKCMILLKELGDIKLNDEDRLENYFGSNEDMETKREVKDFKKLAKENNLDAEDSVKSGRFSVNHKKANKPDIKTDVLLNGIEDIIDMVNFLKGYDGRKHEQQEEIKNKDRLISPLEKKKRKEVDMIIKMVKSLPTFDEGENSMIAYFKIQNILISTGCDLEELFRNNGNMKSQKELLLRAISK